MNVFLEYGTGIGILLYSMVIGGTLLGAFASYNFKGASSSITGFNTQVITGLAKNKVFILGVVLYLIAAANNIFLLGYLDYSILLPLSSITYIWTMIIAYRLLGEVITKRKMYGVAAIIVGVVLLAHG